MSHRHRKYLLLHSPKKRILFKNKNQTPQNSKEEKKTPAIRLLSFQPWDNCDFQQKNFSISTEERRRQCCGYWIDSGKESSDTPCAYPIHLCEVGCLSQQHFGMHTRQRVDPLNQCFLLRNVFAGWWHWGSVSGWVTVTIKRLYYCSLFSSESPLRS